MQQDISPGQVSEQLDGISQPSRLRVRVATGDTPPMRSVRYQDRQPTPPPRPVFAMPCQNVDEVDGPALKGNDLWKIIQGVSETQMTLGGNGPGEQAVGARIGRVDGDSLREERLRIWTPQWKSVRKVKEGETTNDLFTFLTTDPNEEVGAIHPKAMPVILTKAEEIERWMTAPTDEALKLQRPLPDRSLKIVARGSKKDEPSS